MRSESARLNIKQLTDQRCGLSRENYDLTDQRQIYDIAHDVITDHVRSVSWPYPILSEFEVRQIAAEIARRWGSLRELA
jgi:hypothetical protein